MASDTLMKLQTAWDEAEPQDAFFRPPDGTYDTEIESADIGESQAGRTQIAWLMRVTNGKLEGKPIRKYSSLQETANQSLAEVLAWVKGDLKRLGLSVPKSIAKLPETLKQAIGIQVPVTVKTTGEFQAVYFGTATGGISPSPRTSVRKVGKRSNTPF